MTGVSASLERIGARATAPSVLRLAMLLAILFVAVGSLMPLTPSASWTDFRAALLAGMTFRLEPPILATVAERLLVFLPLGLLVSMNFGCLGRRRVPAATLLAVLVAAAIEIAQAAVVARHPRLSDFLLASLFGFMGAALAPALRRLRERLRGRFGGRRVDVSAGRRAAAARRRRIAVGAVLIGGVALCNVALLAVLKTAHSGLGIGKWDCAYHLQIANEATLDRPWRGKIRGLAIYGRAVGEAELAALSRLPMTAGHSEARRRAGALVIYTFDGVDGVRVPDRGAGGNGPLDAEIAGPGRWTLAQGALEIDGPVTVRSLGPAEALCEQIRRSRAFAIEVELAAAVTDQKRPSAIVSMSSPTRRRNFSLEQDRGGLVLRVRAPRHRGAGSLLQTRAADGVVTGAWQRVWAGYGGGQGDIRVDGVRPTVSAAGHRLLVLQWLPVPVSQIAGLMLFVAGAMAGLLAVGRGVAAALLTGYALAAAAPLAGAVALAAWYGHALDWHLLAAAAVAPALGNVVGWALVRAQSHADLAPARA